ncbi:MAG: hypothetical protein EBS07_11660 [Sphingobacteriia bacterium]|nr:hypothetical protein [Sphingobacteriia bacterium]
MTSPLDNNALISLYTAVDPSVLYNNGNAIKKAIYSKAEQDTLSKFHVDATGYLYFALDEKVFPINTKLINAQLAEAALLKLVQKLNSSLQLINSNIQDAEDKIPNLFNNLLTIIDTFPVFHELSGKIWYWTSNYCIMLKPGDYFSEDSKFLLAGEFVSVSYVESQILKMDYCHLPVIGRSISTLKIIEGHSPYSIVYRRVPNMENMGNSIAENNSRIPNILPFYLDYFEFVGASKASLPVSPSTNNYL